MFVCWMRRKSARYLKISISSIIWIRLPANRTCEILTIINLLCSPCPQAFRMELMLNISATYLLKEIHKGSWLHTKWHIFAHIICNITFTEQSRWVYTFKFLFVRTPKWVFKIFICGRIKQIEHSVSACAQFYYA